MTRAQAMTIASDLLDHNDIEDILGTYFLELDKPLADRVGNDKNYQLVQDCAHSIFMATE